MAITARESARGRTERPLENRRTEPASPAGETQLGLFCERVIEAGWLVALIVGPLYFNALSSRIFEPDKATALRVVVLIMLVAWLVRLFERRGQEGGGLRGMWAVLRQSPLMIAALVWVGVLAVATALSAHPEMSFWGSYQRMQGLLMALCYVAIFFFVASYLRSWAQVERAITVILISATLASIYGIGQHYALDPLPWSVSVSGRPSSTLGNPIFLAAYLLMAVPFALVRLTRATQTALVRIQQFRPPMRGESLLAYRLRRVLRHAGWVTVYALVTLLILYAIALTQSRGPWLGLGVALGVFGLGVPALAGRWRLFDLIAIVAIAALGFVLLLNIAGSPLEPLKQVHPVIRRLGSLVEPTGGTGEVRKLIWFGDEHGKGALGLVFSDPKRIVIGSGPEVMQLVITPFYPPDLAHLEARTALPDRSHNDYLDLLVIAGFAGLAAHFLVIGTFIVVALRSLRRATSPPVRLVLLALIAAVLGHLVELTVGIAIVSTRTHFWFFLGLTVAIGRYLLAAEASPSAVPVVAAEQEKAAELPTTRRRRERRKALAQASTRAGPRVRLTAADWALLAYLALTAGALFIFLLVGWAGGMLVLLGALGNSSPEVTTTLIYGWIVLGLVLSAAAIPPRARALIPWRRGQVGYYLALVAVAAVFTYMALLSPIMADVYYKQGQNLEASNRPGDLIARYVEAVRKQPSQDFYWLFLARSLLSGSRAVPEGPPTLTEVRAADVRERDWARTFGSLKREDLFQAALAALEEARRLSPLNTDHYANLARTCKLRSDDLKDTPRKAELVEQMIAWYLRAVQMSPNSALLYDELGQAYQIAGREDDALAAYERAVTLDNRYTLGLLHYADLLQQRGQLDAAAPLYEQVVAVEPANTNAYLALSSLYQRQNQTDQAVAVLQRGLGRVPESEHARLQQALRGISGTVTANR